MVEDLPAAIFCGQVYAPFGWLLPFRGLSSLRAFRNACEASSRERHLRVATFSSTLSRLGRRCYLEQILARGASFFQSSDPNIQREMLRWDSNALVHDDYRHKAIFGGPSAISSSRRYSDISPVQLGLPISNQDREL